MELLSKCGICQASYASEDKTPLLLSCGDTFCSPCLKSIQSEGKITCKDCNEVTVLPLSAGVSALPTNGGLKKLAVELNRMYIFFYVF